MGNSCLGGDPRKGVNPSLREPSPKLWYRYRFPPARKPPLDRPASCPPLSLLLFHLREAGLLAVSSFFVLSFFIS